MRTLTDADPEARAAELPPDALTDRPVHRPGPGRHGPLRGAVALVVLVVVFGFALPRVADYGQVWQTITLLTGPELLVLALVGCWNLFTYWPVLVVAQPGLRLREAAVVNQASTAVANTVPAGAAVAVGVTYRMLRAWGFPSRAIANQILVTGVWNQLAKLVMPAIALVAVAATGEVEGTFVELAAWGSGVLVVVLVGGAVVLRSEGATRRVGRVVDRVVGRTTRVVHVEDRLSRARSELVELIGRVGPALSALSIVSHLSLYLVLLATLRVVGVPDGAASWAKVLMGFALVRLLAAIPVTPGGAGIVELGYVAFLATGTGSGHADQITAAVLLFRAVTYAFPVLAGAVAWLVFTRATHWRHPPGSRTATATRRTLVRSPIHLFALVLGLLVAAIGWAAATLFERTIRSVTIDLGDLVHALPANVSVLAGAGAAVGTFAVAGLVHVWTVRAGRVRELAIAYVAAGTAVGLSLLGGAALESVMRPEVRAYFEEPAGPASTLPTYPTVAAAVAALVVARRVLPARTRRVVYAVGPLWLLSHVLVDPAVPYLGVILDVGAGMVAGSVVALVLRTPSLRPDRDALAAGIAASGTPVTALRPADVDARGSVPWFATASDGRRLFVKALSTEQRVADLMYRALRWLRLRRTGDAPPEVSLRRAAEHEALLSHHVRLLGVPTPTVVTVADLGDDNVALVYERADGRSLDAVRSDAVTDDVLRQLWEHVLRLRANGVAHRDLRLANVFLRDDGEVLLIDFGFGELAASQQLLDTDVAELLAATAVVVGVERATRAAAEIVGPDVLAAAREWLHPLALSDATRRALRQADLVRPLREEVRVLVGGEHDEHLPLGRLSAQRLFGAGLLAVGLYVLAEAARHADLGDRIAGADPDLVVGSVLLGALYYVVAGLAFRAASGHRVSASASAVSVLVSRLPLAAPTPWSAATRLVSERATADGMSPGTARASVAGWAGGAIAVGPVLVAGFAAAAFRVTEGYATGIVLGLGCGLGLGAAQVGLLWLSPWGRDLVRVWLRPVVSQRPEVTTVSVVLGWWAVAAVVHATAFVLAARAVDVTLPAEALVAVWIAANAVAALTPAPGGIGAIEIALFLGLSVGGVGFTAAAAAVVVARLATFWIHLPFASVLRLRTAGTRAREVVP